MEIAVIGVNHLTAPIQIREQVSFTDTQKIEVLNQLLDYNVREAVVLSTCNRSEIYICSEHIESKIACVSTVYHDFSKAIGLETYMFVKKGEEAIRHLYRVAAGLDSIVLGEDQILGQVKDAQEFAMELGASGKVLNKCFREAITTAKHIKAEMKISEYPLSISYIGVKCLRQQMGTLEGATGLLIGAGKMSKLALNHLYEEGVDTIYIANRTCKKAEDLKEQYEHIVPIPYEKRYEIMREVDFVITSTASPHLVVKEREMPELTKHLYMLDIALPRDIEESIGGHEHVHLYDIDDLQYIADHNTAKREALAEEAASVVEANLRELMLWLQTIKIDPTIKSLHDRCDEIQEDTMAYIRRKTNLSTKEEKIVEKMLMSSLKRLIREPIHNLKELQDQEKQETYNEIIKELFEL
ncbi:MAG: glutamyl-tRNA reductase [Cellulosilyticaceae bacterium]